jgi:hypothetical protein
MKRLIVPCCALMPGSVAYADDPEVTIGVSMPLTGTFARRVVVRTIRHAPVTIFQR